MTSGAYSDKYAYNMDCSDGIDNWNRRRNLDVDEVVRNRKRNQVFDEHNYAKRREIESEFVIANRHRYLNNRLMHLIVDGQRPGPSGSVPATNVFENRSGKLTMTGAERIARFRSNESPDQRTRRLELDFIRHRNVRQDSSQEQRQLILALDRNRHFDTRTVESVIDKQKRLEFVRNRMKVSRQGVIQLYAAEKHENAIEHRLSQMSICCVHCAALHFAEEKVSGKGTSFGECCHHGKVFLPQIPEQDFPEVLRDLFLKLDARHVNFFENIRHLNSSVSFASMNPLRYRYPNNRGPYCFRIYGQIYHRMNLALNPDNGDEPAYGQIFIVDTEQAMRTIEQANVGVDLELLRTVYYVIRNMNPFAEAYLMMKEEENSELEKARIEQRQPVEIKLLFETGKQMDRRLGYNVPRANEVAAVYVPGADGEVPEAKIVVRQKGKELKILNSTDAMVTPMTYPLFYPHGTFGWHPEIKQRNSNRRVTRLQYTSYTLAIREKEFNPILYGGKLFQQYCVDEYVKIEGDRMRWIRNNQKKICAEAYKNIDNILLRRAQETGLPLGRKVILPPSMTNSPRYVEKHFQDAMAVVRRFGKPDLFLTMTCNPQWSEIIDNMFHEQVPSDRPDLVVRVFYLKVKAIMNQITKTKIFGEVIAWMYPVENQGRGLPHIHLLLTLSEQDKLITGEDVEKRGISARIPDKDKEPELYALVKKFMVHGPCGDLNPNCPCMEETVNENGLKIRKCSKAYPKAFQEENVVLENGLALYARPNDGRTVEVRVNGRRIELDNRWVVPHNLYLLKMFKCHINLEKVNSVSSVKYLHKYVHKPPDRARLELESINDHDEVKEFIDARYVCPQEAVWRILELPMYDRSHSIMSLSVHLQGEQICYFDENMTEEEIRDKINSGSELMAYFEVNKTNALAKNLLYHQIPEKFCLKKGKWTERKAHFNTIGRMVKVSPAEPERYHLRLLLLHVKGACSYDELKTIRNLDGSVKVCTTFAEACLEKGLIRNDEEWKRALEEAESFEMPWKLRDFFALILVHCNPAKPEELWEMFKESLSEDFSRSFRQEIAYAKAYREIALSIKKAGKTLADFPSMEQINVDEDIEQAINAAEELDQGVRAFDLMYDEQKIVTDLILTRIRNPVNEPAFFFLSGPGGTGKTHVNKTIVHLLRGEKKKVSTMAFTGMAATLLPAGRTLHNRFGLSLDMSNSNISPRSKAWQELKETDLFICDEAPMINKRAMRTLDEKLKEIMNNDIAFGGKVMLWTGDFRQTLPIQKHATRSELVNSTIKRSEYWRTAKKYKLTKNMRALETEQTFAKDLLEIGTGKWNNENDEIILPEGCISNGDLAEEIFGNFIVSENWNEMAKSAILAPKNLDVSELNKKVLDMMPGEETVYISIDRAEDENRQRADEYLDEYLNALNPSGFSKHELKLKKNAIVMLIRNMNIELGLCNGARMKVEEMRKNLIVCKILTGDKAGQTVYIPRITLCCAEEYPFDLHRHQFPLVLAFAMTINKAQGQTLERVGIDLRKEVFSHGQLYVALSRARAWNMLRIRLDYSNLDRKVKNVVYKELLDEDD